METDVREKVSAQTGYDRPRKRSVLILAYSDLSRDPRVSRQIKWLCNDFAVTAAGISPPDVGGIDYINLAPPPAITPLPEDSHPSIRSIIARMPFARSTYRSIKRLRSRIADVPYARKTYRWIKTLLKRISPLETIVREGNVASPNEEINIISTDERHIHYFNRKLRAIINYAALDGIAPDLIIANDLDCLVIANQLFPDTKTLFDAHEYAPLEYNEGYEWINHEKPARIYFCTHLLPRVSAMTTVCQGIANEYMAEFKLQHPVEVITNAPFYEKITPRRTGQKIRIVHHGAGAAIRKIELMIEAVKLLDERFELYLMLVEGSADYIRELKSRYASQSRIHFIDPVPMPEISRFISQFDVGMFILEPAIFNYRLALPNKFFEFIQARLAIAIGPSPEMERLVKQHNLGVVASDFSPQAMANSLAVLSASDFDQFKANAHRVAHEFSAESNEQKMTSMVHRIANAGVNRRAAELGA